MRRFLLLALLCPLLAFAGDIALDKAPDRSGDRAALQHGAKLFVNYCLNCHSASYMRYNRLKDIGLSEEQIKDSLMFTATKTGEPMRIAMQREDAKAFFGVAPPDLTVIARAKASEEGSGPDWLYTYLRSFYRDDSRPSGWNNRIFPNVAMPHALWELQGEQVLGADGELTLARPGKLKPAEYDAAVADLVGFLSYMGEPVAHYRKFLGWIVLVALVLVFAFTRALKLEFWKDVH